jgi:hypothetical protein
VADNVSAPARIIDIGNIVKSIASAQHARRSRDLTIADFLPRLRITPVASVFDKI